MRIWCRLIIWFLDHLPFMIIYCPTVSVMWRMLKLCENGSNIDYLYETSSVLTKATEIEFRVWPFGFSSFQFGFLKTETEPKFSFRTSLLETFGLWHIFHWVQQGISQASQLRKSWLLNNNDSFHVTDLLVYSWSCYMYVLRINYDEEFVQKPC